MFPPETMIWSDYTSKDRATEEILASKFPCAVRGTGGRVPDRDTDS